MLSTAKKCSLVTYSTPHERRIMTTATATMSHIICAIKAA